MQMGMEVLLYIAGFGILLLFLRLFAKPLRFVLRVGVNTVLGGILLMLLNSFGSTFGLQLAVNPFTALVAGMLGLPGIFALLLSKLWL